MVGNNFRIAALLAAIACAAVFRLVPHPPNFSPIAAMALFSGAYLPRRALAFAAPLAALFLSDLVLGFYPGIAFVYASVALTVVIGWAISTKRSAPRIASAAVAGSVLFYVLTNFGTWLTTDMYPKTIEGLAACYVAAIPFFQNTLAGDLVFTALLFGVFAAAERAIPRLREVPQPQLA